jgi:hypothetical protein
MGEYFRLGALAGCSALLCSTPDARAEHRALTLLIVVFIVVERRIVDMSTNFLSSPDDR